MPFIVNIFYIEDKIEHLIVLNIIDTSLLFSYVKFKYKVQSIWIFNNKKDIIKRKGDSYEGLCF